MRNKLEKLVVDFSISSASLLEMVQWDHKEINREDLKNKVRELEQELNELKKEIENDSCG